MKVTSTMRNHYLILFLVALFVAFAWIGPKTGPAFADQNGAKGSGDPFLDNGRYKITFEPQGNGSPNIVEYSDLKIQVYDGNKELCDPFYDGMGNTQEMWDKKEFIADFDGRKANRVDISCYFNYAAGEHGEEGTLFQGDIKTSVRFQQDKTGTLVSTEINGAGTVYLGTIYIEAAPYDISGTGKLNNHDSGETIGSFEIPGGIEGLSAYPGEQVTVQFLHRRPPYFEYSLRSISVNVTKTEETEEVFTTDPPDGEVQNFTFTMPASDVRLDYCKMEPEPYIDEEGKDAQCWDYTYLGQLTERVSGEGYSIDDVNKGWYVTDGTEDINLERAVCKGDVNIILADDSSTTFGRGIEVNESNEASLTIWGQKKGSGRLEAYSYYKNEGDTGVYDAAIGGGRNKMVGSITINGGIVVADADSKVDYDGYPSVDPAGAGIGSGQIAYSGGASIGCGSVTINGGDVTAIGGDNAAGIGGGQWDQAKARITINGGKVNASGGGAGIGTGPSSCKGFGEIKITGGSVTAKSRSKEIAGIGGLSTGNEDTITINGGTVNAEGSPAIGVTGKEETGKITVGGGTTTAQGTEYGSGLRASSVIITKGTVNAYGAGKGAGIGGYTKLSLASNEAQRTFNGLVEIRGGSVTAIGGSEGAGIGGTNNGDMKGPVKISGGNVTATGKSGGAGIGGGDSGEFSGSITVTGGTVKATASDDGAGIGGGDGDPLAGPVTISGGKVFAYGGDQGAGIGSARGYSQIGNITIKGGEVTATGGDKGAGIGGGDEGNGGTVLIEKGTVTAIGGRHGAGIGGGNKGHGGTLTVKDGNVTVNGGEYGAGIGGGEDGNGGTLTIQKGSVVVKSGGNGAGVGGGYGGEAGYVTLNNGFLSAKAVDATSLLYRTGGGAGIGHGGQPDFSYWDPEKQTDAFFIMHNGTLHAKGATSAAGIGGSEDTPGIDVKILGGESFVMSGINLNRVIGAGFRINREYSFGDLQIADDLLVDLNGWKPDAAERIKTLRTCGQAYILHCSHAVKTITKTDTGHKVVCKHCNAFSGKEEAHVAGTDLTEENRKAANCTEEGSYDLMTECSVCKAKFCLEHCVIAPLGHDWDEGHETKPAVEDQDGIKTFECTRCGQTRTEIIPAPAPTHVHSWDKGTETLKAGCTTEGLTTYHCETCDEVQTKVVEALGHSQSKPEEVPVRPADCERNGYVYLFYRCSKCGESLHRELKPIPALGHDFGDWECLDENKHRKVCSRDPLHTQQEDHSWDEGVVVKEATANKAGARRYLCTVCGTARTEIIPPSEHEISTAEAQKNGGISVDKNYAEKGAAVTLTLEPDQYCRLKSGTLSVVGDSGTNINVKKTGNNKYSFEMPDENVMVSAEFEWIPILSVNGRSTYKMNEGETWEISADIHPDTANPLIIWTTSDKTIATVESLAPGSPSKAMVKALKAGTVRIKGTSAIDSTLFFECDITVVHHHKQTPAKVSGKQTARMTAKGKKSLTIGWNKIKGVAGYDVFFARCNYHGKKLSCRKIKTVKGNKKFTLTKKGLKKGISYKAYVKAFVMKNGKKKYVRTSSLMHAYTGKGNKKYTNAKSVSIKNVKKGKLILKKGKAFKIKAKVKKLKKNKKLFPKGHAPTLRYMTSDKKIATVSSKGKIKAKAKGKCYIYAYAHNGVSKKIKVIVK